MPIGDLLAQISGGASDSPGAPKPAPIPGVLRAPTLPKRKADDDLRLEATKLVRRPSPPKTSSTANGSTSLSYRPSNGNGVKPVSRPTNGPSQTAKPAAATPTTRSPAPASSAPPKKGSFAEILARGQRAQQVMGQVGKIQHKKVEKGAIKQREGKDPKEARDVRDRRATEPKPSARGAPSKPAGYSGSSRPGQHRAPLAGASKEGPKAARNGNGAGSRDSKRPSPADEPPKKIKKSAMAVTGYSGTARAQQATAAKKNAPSSRGGALLNPVPSRPKNSRSSRYDDYDEELDDFIDYDEDEDDGGGGGPRYDYASDGSSDMEAGLSDIDVEETQAERIARREDQEQDRLEKSLKQAKEERKRKALEALRANRR